MDIIDYGYHHFLSLSFFPFSCFQTDAVSRTHSMVDTGAQTIAIKEDTRSITPKPAGPRPPIRLNADVLPKNDTAPAAAAGAGPSSPRFPFPASKPTAAVPARARYGAPMDCAEVWTTIFCYVAGNLRTLRSILRACKAFNAAADR